MDFSAHGPPRLPWDNNTAQVSVNQRSSPRDLMISCDSKAPAEDGDAKLAFKETYIMREPHYHAAGLLERPDVLVSA